MLYLFVLYFDFQSNSKNQNPTNLRLNLAHRKLQLDFKQKGGHGTMKFVTITIDQANLDRSDRNANNISTAQ